MNISYDYPAGKNFEPVGRCIYCLRADNPENLTREHIVPYGLNGTLILPNASCIDCAKITGSIERFCLQEMFIDARRYLNLASRSRRRNKKTRSAPRVGLLDQNKEFIGWQELSKDQHPFMLVTLDFPPPGLIFGRASGVEPKIQAVIIPSPQFADRFSKLPSNAALYAKLDPELFIRMIAKIAHSFAVAQFGLAAFRPFLPELILGRTRNFYDYVGGAYAGHSLDRAELHILEARKERGIIISYIRLFAALNAPAYSVIVGQYSS